MKKEVMEIINNKLNKFISCEDNEEVVFTQREVLFIREHVNPPTAPVVCKALNEYYGAVWEYEKYIYNHGKFYIPKQPIHCSIEKGKIQFSCSQPPHLITMIGRFYEGVMKDE